MRSWMRRWALASTLVVAVGVGSVRSASAQFFDDSRDREETRPAQTQPDRPGMTERLRQWFEGERESRQQLARDQQRMQSQRERRRALSVLNAAYVAGYLDGYQDAINDHLILLLDEQERQGIKRRMAPEQRGLSPRDREQFHRSLREQFRGRVQRPVGAASQQLSGEILRTKQVELKNTGQEHLVVLVETNEGRRRIVDLGPARNLKDLDLSRGDRISVRGQAARAAGNVPIVLGQEVKAGGQQITIQRQPPKQEATLPKPDQEKKQDQGKKQQS